LISISPFSLFDVENVYTDCFTPSGGVVTTAAVRLGLHRTTLNAMMGKLGISRKDL
jgi:transcriptional regulator with GAF, ATPase, and Fis domain